MKKTDVAWAAGFFDGEGCISVYPTRTNGYSLRVGAAQKVSAPLEKLEEMFGGGIGYYVAKSGKSCFHWNVYGANALRFLQTISPYLIVKQEQADVAIGFQLRRQVGTNFKLTKAEVNADKRDYKLLRELKVIE